jgi:Holliday junction resolvase
MREKDVVRDIMNFLKDKYPGFYFKSHGGPFQMVGLPDIIGCHKGRFIGIEVKLPGKEDTLTPIQKKVIEMISKAGGISFMATSVEQVRKILKEQVRKILKEEFRKWIWKQE